MADLNIGAKPRRALTFTLGLSDPHIWLKLTPYGLDQAEIAKGTERLNALTTARLAIKPAYDANVLATLDAWENHWFPIVEVVLRTNYPDVHAVVFLNLTQTSGVDVIVGVRTLLDRLDLVAKPVEDGGHAQGPAAIALLEKRGFKSPVRLEARGLLAQVGTVPADLADVAPVDAEAIAKAEQDLWNWYLEWSGIARTVIRDRTLLRKLGFLRRVRRPDGREEDVLVDDDDLEETDDVIVTGQDVDDTNAAGDDVTGDDLVTGPTPPTPEPEPEPNA